MQANLQERARAIIEARPDLEHNFGDLPNTDELFAENGKFSPCSAIK